MEKAMTGVTKDIAAQKEAKGEDYKPLSNRKAAIDKALEGGSPVHESLPVLGYSPQPNANVMAVNHNKQLEETLLRVLDGMKTNTDIDQRWLAIGRTHIEEGFMAINRAVFKPGRVVLPSDG